MTICSLLFLQSSFAFNFCTKKAGRKKSGAQKKRGAKKAGYKKSGAQKSGAQKKRGAKKAGRKKSGAQKKRGNNMAYWLQKNDKGWWLMSVDAEPQIIPHECYVELHLYEKEVFSKEDVDRIHDFIQRKAAQKVLSRISPMHNKSAKQIVQKLVDNKISEEIAKKIVTESIEEGRIDDMETIGRWIRDSESHRFRSRKSLLFELLKRGFKKEDIEYSLSEVPNFDEMAIQNLCKKRFVQQLSQEKTIKYFVNKGFSMDTIRRTLLEISEHE